MSLNNTMWTFFGVDFEQLLAWGVLRHEFNASSSNTADSDTTGGSVCLAIVSLLAWSKCVCSSTSYVLQLHKCVCSSTSYVLQLHTFYY